MKRVQLISTGGTISSLKKKEDETVIPTLTGAELMKGIPGLGEVAKVDTLDYSRVPGQYLDFQDVLGVADEIEKRARASEYDGFLVTMGTNIIEEASYCLDLLLEIEQPIIVTGAMRNPTLPSSDAPMNLHNSVIAAASDTLRGEGCVVCMNGELHHARYVAKTNTVSTATFQSPGIGPIGVIRSGSVVAYTRNLQREHIRPSSSSTRVDLVRYGMGMDGSLLEAALGLGAKGIVIEAWGGGHLTPKVVPAVQRAIARNVPVVLTSRCPTGELLEDTYGFEGSETHLRRLGVIFASGLTGIKARIKLVLLLDLGLSNEQVREAFEHPQWSKNRIVKI
jgi:L-asparaginase